MRDYSRLTNDEVSAEIAHRVYGDEIIWDEFLFNGKRCRYPLIKMPSVNSKSVPMYSESLFDVWPLFDWLTEREGEVWVSRHGYRHDQESDKIVPREKPYPVVVTLPGSFWSTPELPFARAICTAVLMWLDMDEDLRRLAREGE